MEMATTGEPEPRYVCNCHFHVWEDTNLEMKPFVLPQVLLLHGSGFN